MLIDNVEIWRLNIASRTPIKTPIGTLNGAANVLIKILTNTGLVGWGEASPFAPITGDSQDSAYSTAQVLAVLIQGKNPLSINARMTEINRYTCGEPSIRSAFDMALHDIAAQSAKMPLYQFLGGEERLLQTDVTIGMLASVEQTIAQSKKALAKGFDQIKLKVGRPGLEDVAHVKAVREIAGNHIQIKIDSNQGWDYPTALANLRAMAPLNIQYAEQPIAAWNINQLQQLRANVDLPICADESVFDDKDALTLVTTGAADYLNIKLGKAGGMLTAQKINTIAEAAGCKCMIGCFAESILGLTAAAHLAMAHSNITFLDLDSALDFSENPIVGGIQYDAEKGGVIHLSNTPGLGAYPDETYLDHSDRLPI